MIRPIAVLCAMLGVALTQPAYASDDSREARVLYQKGSLAFKDGDDVLARRYYLESLELEESFETMCNLARTEARSEFFVEAYEHVRMCLYLFPSDEELQGAKEKYSNLRDIIRTELTYEQAYPVDKKVEKEIERRKNERTVVEDQATHPEPASQGKTSVNEKKNASSAKVPVAVTVGALGVVGLGTGVVLMSVAASHKRKALALGAEVNEDSDLPENSACFDPTVDARCGQLSEHIRKVNSNRNAGIVSYAIGGTLVTGAVITYVLWPKPKKPGAWLRPSVEYAGPGGWQLGFHGRF